MGVGEEEENMSPFWLQSRSRQRRRTSSGVLIIILLLVTVAFVFFIIPSFLSFARQIFRPNVVKKSWDSLNLVLVLFAVVCGFLCRNTSNSDSDNSNSGINENTATRSAYEDYKFENGSESFQKSSNPETPRRFWCDHQPGTALNRLRSFSSYPDLRQEEALWTSRDDQWRFCDDTHLYNPRSSNIDYLSTDQWRQPQQQKLEVEDEEIEKEKVKDIVEDAKNMDVEEESQKEVIYTPPPETAPLPAPSPSPPRSPEPPQAKVVRRKVRRTYQDLGKKEKSDHQNIIQRREASPPRPSSPPPPQQPMFGEGGNNEKKRGGTNATKEFLTSLRRRKKKQRQKSVENLDFFFNYESSYPLPSIPPPSPPPPPPPFFHNLFSPKKRKTKKIYSDIPIPPPPPPRPPPRIQKFSASAAASKVESKNAPFTSQKLPLPVKIKNYNNVVEENVNGGNESPMNSIPPPPPLPSFKMPAWKFEVHGDFVRLKSNIGEDIEESSSPSDGGGGAAATESGDGALTPLFCPSPDVDTKADNFIARFRAGLRLEKMNSIKDMEGIGRSNLGTEPSPSPDEYGQVNESAFVESTFEQK